MNYEIIPSNCDLVSDTTCSSHPLPDTTNMFDIGTSTISSSNLSPAYSVVDHSSSASSVARQYTPRAYRAPTQPKASKPKLGTYEIDRTIGKGIFSVVKLARHTITGLNLAIKLIDKTRLDSENLIKIYRESEILKKLHHPNIVRLFQVMETPKLLCIVMEYLPNGEVFDYIATHGRFSEAEARVKFLDVLSAVDYAHSCGIVHRDLKAENLLFDANMNIKLIDFSFGTHHPDSKRPHSLLSTWCGSPPYAAPEIFKGEPYVGTKADIWSLGVVLYVMVCGTLPFDAQALPHLRHQVLSASFRVPYWLSCVCERLIRWMLSKVPSKRPTTQEIFHHAWFTQPLPELSRDRSILPVETGQRDSGVNCPVWSHERSHSRMGLSDCGESNLNSSRTSLVDPLSNLAADVELGRVNEFVILIMESYGMKRSQIFESLSRRAYDHLMATYLLLGEKIRQKRFSLNLSNLAPNSLNELVSDNCPVDSEAIPHRSWTAKHSQVDSAVDVKSSISDYEAPRVPGDFSASLPDSEVGIVPSAFLYSTNTTLPAPHIRSWLPQSSDVAMEQIQQLPPCSEQLGATDPMQSTMTWTIQQPLPSNRCLAIPALDNPTQVLDEAQLVASIQQHRLVDFGEDDQVIHPWLIPAHNDLEDAEPSGSHTPLPSRRTLVRRKYGVFNPPAYLDQLAQTVLERERQAPPTLPTDPDDEDSTHQTINET